MLMMQQDKYDNGFPADFMKQLKVWCKDLPDKKLIKNGMQLASFTKREVVDVGSVAMVTALNCDQNKALLI